MMNFRIACATDDGKHLIDRHFGDAEQYLIYDLTKHGKITQVGAIANTSEEETKADNEIHGDPEKAASVKELLQQEGVQVLLSQAFGPNIVRIKKHFVPVVSNTAAIQTALKQVSNTWKLLTKEWKRPEERQHIVLND